ncbi:UNVERIFIED_CONTAM: hypothetical protein Sangu_2204000 [Sesamum angustifolium]|uniref:Uncharacterized protein n=1 Tax=Sesamum angustifolium TaxID=2727405 RepID=A0AAW2LEZ9_9LAMI
MGLTLFTSVIGNVKTNIVSKQIFPLTPVEQQAVKGIRRKLDAENCPTESCAFKRRRDAQYHLHHLRDHLQLLDPSAARLAMAWI